MKDEGGKECFPECFTVLIVFTSSFILHPSSFLLTARQAVQLRERACASDGDQAVTGLYDGIARGVEYHLAVATMNGEHDYVQLRANVCVAELMTDIARSWLDFELLKAEV